jgi:DNA-binding transcriptional regulator YiaG
MIAALLDTEAGGYQLQVVRPGGGRVSAVCSEASSIIVVDRSQARPVPPGVQLLDAFLDEFEARPEIAELLPDARRDLSAGCIAEGAPLTLRILRLNQGMSQKEFAAALRTSQAAVSAYENRSRRPNEDMIRSMSAVLGVDFNTLMEALANAGV